MKETLTIVKVGGAVVEDEQQLARLLDDFARIEGRRLLVHGGGRRATRVATALGIESRMVNGRRITDEKMLEVVTMVYGGLVNKHIVALLQAHEINALGLTGADMNVIRSHRRPPVNVAPSPQEGIEEGQTVDFGFVGDVERVDAQKLSLLIEAGITPVVSPLTHDGKGSMLNTNADTMAGETAKALAALYDVRLVYCFEKNGVLSNPDDEDSVIATINREDFDRYVADGTIAGGMIPKIENALQAVEAGVGKVVITKATALLGNQGTVISYRKRNHILTFLPSPP